MVLLSTVVLPWLRLLISTSVDLGSRFAQLVATAAETSLAGPFSQIDTAI